MEIIENYYGWILLIITIIVFFIVKRLSKNPDALTSKYTAEKTIQGSPGESLKKIGKALKNSGFRQVGLDEDEKVFYANTKFSMSSFSEVIFVYYVTDEKATHIIFKSICGLPTQIFAWGKNKRNYKRFEKELEKLG